jgi:uncharacterized protein (TIGR02271 family)
MVEDIDSITVVEEELQIEKRQVLDGTVEVRTHTDNIEEHVTAHLVRERLDVQRVLFDVFVDVAPTVRVEGDVTIVPVLEERLVVEKRLVLVEELHIRKTTSSETERVDAVLRKQRVTVERTETKEGEDNG